MLRHDRPAVFCVANVKTKVQFRLSTSISQRVIVKETFVCELHHGTSSSLCGLCTEI